MKLNKIPITNFQTEIALGDKNPEKIDEETVRKISCYLLNEYVFSNPLEYSKKDILSGIIQFSKCNVSDAQKIFEKMEELGLSLFTDQNYVDLSLNDTQKYHFVKFSQMRGYITFDEMMELTRKHSDYEYDEDSDEENY